MRVIPEIEHELEGRISDLGYELVDVRWGGSSRRPLLRLRIDRPDSTPGTGVTVEDCAIVSRGLESWLDEHERLSERYTLEVSSPGVDRPLVRPGDFERFRGEMIAVKGDDVLAGRARRLEGELVGLSHGDTEGRAVLMRLPGGDEVRIPMEDIRNAHLVFTWE
jgi:ribosome maturation factor RimP